MNEPTKGQAGSTESVKPDVSAEGSPREAVAASIPPTTPKDAVAAGSQAPAQKPRKLDYGFLPIPKSRRYDPDGIQFSPLLNYLFAFVRF